MELYPFKFEPILKPIIWGGSEICKFKDVTQIQDNIGESWEISDVKGDVSIVANGEHAGKTLEEILTLNKEKLVGKAVYEKFGNTFPLLIKFIDAKSDLSIQVHPNDELAKKRHNSFGKTEMWYVINAEPGAYLYSGFEKPLDPDAYEQSINDNTFTDYLKKYYVKPGDVFFLPAGRVHAIGTGCFIAEIQQTSNITYRIYDYNRRDAEGNTRELHTELAKDAIDFSVLDDYRTQYTPDINKAVELVSSNYFTTNLLDIDETIERSYSDIDSFIVYICMHGSCTLKDDKGNSIGLVQGETILLPANTKMCEIVAHGPSKLLETYVK